MRKKIFFFLFLFYSSLSAQSYNLKINLKEGGHLILPIESIQKITFSNVTSVSEMQLVQKVINNFNLLQNYPNPFNLNTTISFYLPEKGHLNLSIFNVNGRLVKKLYDGVMNEGNHELIWQGQDTNNQIVSTGVYFYNVKFENETITKKMILVK